MDNLDKKRKVAEQDISISDDKIHILYPDDLADSLDQALKKDSEDTYRDIAQKIVDKSLDQLDKQNDSKSFLKKAFTWFFIVFLSIQYIVLVCLLINKAGCSFGFLDFSVSDTIIVTYISSVFVETLGAIVLMIRYAFNSDQEENILQILNQFMTNFQKYK